MAAAFVLLALLGMAGCGDDEPAPSVIEVPEWAKVAPEQIAEAKKHGVPVAFENDLGMRFVLIPAGTFTMGFPEDEEGKRDFTLNKPFYLQITEVTNEQYRRLQHDHDSGEVNGRSLNEDHQPAVMVSWEDCQEFVERLSQSVSGDYRLPTEAEWEYACRAGTTTRYCSGNTEKDLAQVGWYFRNSGDQRLSVEVLYDRERTMGEWACRPRPVGGKPANAWGLHDMHGNVCEWCHYVHRPVGAPPVGDPEVADGDSRVIRGGSWDAPAWGARSGFRFHEIATSRTAYFGFRLVSPLIEKEK